MKFLFPALHLQRAVLTRVLWTRRLLADFSGVQTEPVPLSIPGDSTALPSPLGAGVLHGAPQGGLGSVEKGVVGENPPGAGS